MLTRHSTTFLHRVSSSCSPARSYRTPSPLGLLGLCQTPVTIVSVHKAQIFSCTPPRDDRITHASVIQYQVKVTLRIPMNRLAEESQRDEALCSEKQLTLLTSNKDSKQSWSQHATVEQVNRIKHINQLPCVVTAQGNMLIPSALSTLLPFFVGSGILSLVPRKNASNGAGR